MYYGAKNRDGLGQLYSAMQYQQQLRLQKEAEAERKRQLEEQRRQQREANKHSAFGANLQALGTIGGSIAGAFIGGPTGAAAGAGLGSALASGTMALAPNIGGTQPDASNPYYQPASDLQRGATALQSGLQVWSTYENQIREPWLRKAGNATKTNTYKHFQEGGDVAATQKYMSPQEGSKFSQAMIDAGYNADNLPWYISEDDIVNLQNEQYITFNETIAPIGQTAKVDILNDVAMVGETMGNVGLDHIRELTLRKTAKERMAYLEEQGIDNPHLRSIAEQPTWLINQGWAKGRELRNATLEEQRKAIAELKKENRDARIKEIDSRYNSVMRTWDDILNNPTEMRMKGYEGFIDKEMNADVFTQIYDRKYGLSSGNRPEMYYDVLRRYAGGDAQDYFSTSTNPKVQQAYQLFLSQEQAGVLFSQTGGVAQDQSSATSKKEPSTPQGEVAQQTDTITPATPNSSTSSEETSPTGKPLINESARKSLSLDQQKELEQYLETPYQSFSKTDVFGNRIGGETPEEAARKAQERMQGYTFQDKQDYIKRTGSLKGFYDQFASDQATRETKQDAPEVAEAKRQPKPDETTNAVTPQQFNQVARPVGQETTGAPSLSQIQELSTPELNQLDPNMREALRREASQRRAGDLEAVAASSGATAQSLADAEQDGSPAGEVQAVAQVGETKEGQKVWVDQYGREFSELTITIPMQEENADDILYINIPTVVNETGQILTNEEAAAMVDFKDPRDFNTGKQLPVFETEEDAIRGAIQRSEYLGREDYKGPVNPKKATSEEYFESVGDYQKQDDFVATSDRQGARQRARDAKAAGPLPESVGTPAAPTNATLRNLIENTPPPAAPDPLEAKPTRTTGRQVRTIQGLIDEANRDVTMDARQEDQSRKAADRWNEYQKRKAELIGKERAKVQPIQEGETPAKEPIQDRGTTRTTLGDGFYTKGGRFRPGELEKVKAAQDRDNATEARMDAADDLRYDPRQDRASEFRKAPPTVPNRYQDEGLPVAPPEEKSLRDAIIEGFPATERDNLTGIMEQIIALESDGDETAESAAGATGILQLMPGTVEQLMGKDADASDDDTYVAAAVKLFTKNSSLLERNGYSINALNMYVLHHFGAGGKKLLDADSDTLVKDVKYYNVVSKKDTPLIQQREVNANPWINSAAEINQKTWKDLTVGEFLEYLEQAVNSGDFPQPDPQVVAAANNAKVL